MQAEDFGRFRSVMAGMAKLYEREIDGPLLDAYWLALRTWSLPDFEAAAGRLMATETFMPRPADFNALRKASRPTSGEAWSVVLDHVRSGRYRWSDGGTTFTPNAPPPPDELTNAAVRALGGYKAIAMIDEDQLPFLERRFAEHYTSMQDAAEIRQSLPQIAGPPARELLGHDA